MSGPDPELRVVELLSPELLEGFSAELDQIRKELTEERERIETQAHPSARGRRKARRRPRTAAREQPGNDGHRT